MKRQKYRARKTTLNGITFDSKAEAKYYSHLLREQARGRVKSFKMQQTFELLPKFKHPGTGKAVRAIKYIPDFVIEYADGTQKVVDVKGFETADFKLKKKIFMYKYGLPLVLAKLDSRTGLFYEE